MGFLDIVKRVWGNETFRMMFIAAGIMICFVYFGVMQEKIMRGCFGGELNSEGKCVGGGEFKNLKNALSSLSRNFFTLQKNTSSR